MFVIKCGIFGAEFATFNDKYGRLGIRDGRFNDEDGRFITKYVKYNAKTPHLVINKAYLSLIPPI